MKRFNDSKIMLLLLAFVLALMLTAASANADFTFGTPTNLGPGINTTYDEEGSFISADGCTLYFQSNRPGGQGGSPWDLWVATRPTTDAEWGPPENLGPTVNTTSFEGSVCILADGLSLYFASNQPGGFGGFDLWVTTRATKADKWGIPVNLSGINGPSDDCDASISSDGLELYFVSNRAGGHGSLDLWVTTRATLSDLWGPPVNLGSIVNSSSPSLNYWPSISPDGLSLFFTSNRPGGYGPDDVYMTRRATRNDPWGLPVNLGPPVNTSADNGCPNISADGRTLYFTSNRAGGIGSSDLWQVPIIPIFDFNGDEIVDFKDFSKLAQYWGQDESSVDIAPPFGDGVVDFQDLAVFAENWLKELGQAWGPTPADGATNQPKSILRWNAGQTANAHDVYFGTDRTTVENADTSSPLYIDKVVEKPGVQPSSTKAVSLQQASKTYYWRIDEVEVDGVTIHKGDIWTFSTAGLKAHSPSPADNAQLVDPNAPLSWGPGFTARYHEVYLGTDRTAVENANTSSPLYKGRKTPPYTPGNLNKDTWYYWRVDEVESVQTIKYKGDVWQFKTIGTGGLFF
jgi:hypothetical protein